MEGQALSIVNLAWGWGALVTMDTDSSQPHLQYSTSYEERNITGTRVKVRAVGGSGGSTSLPIAVMFWFYFCLSLYCGI